MIERYTLWCSATHRHRMLETNDGQYVTYADHQASLALRESEIERLNNVIDSNLVLHNEDIAELQSLHRGAIDLIRERDRYQAALEKIKAVSYGSADKVTCIVMLDAIRMEAEEALRAEGHDV